ncbi:DUF4034 domain-containing protein [Nocardiopsis sp. CNT-189]|uniref:hypothetical protein n=1 Tax=Nocardiopsis oceanisediminis TaxID=2816862 RepID=UPI003B2DACA1
MAFSRIRKSLRAMKNLEKVEAGLPPEDAVVLDADDDDPELVEAVHAAWAGDPGPVARLLEAARQAGDRELYGHYAAEAAEAALDRDRWLQDWLAGSPDDPDALLVFGGYLLDRAWESRGGAYASRTSDEQFAGFHHYLDRAEPVLRRAIAADPASPAPWALMITYAVGSPGGRRDLYDEAWAGVLRLNRYDREAHRVALQYNCAKWHGSNEEMFAFAYAASDSAPAGSPLHVLPLRAWVELDVREKGKVLDRPECREAANRALTVCPPAAPAAYRWDRADRNMLARVLCAQDRYDEAYAQFQALGVHATSFPWTYYGTRDARADFLTFRQAAVLKVAEEMR